MDIGTMRGPMKFQKAPLFKMEDAPCKRQPLGGYHVGDLVWLSDLGKPGVRRKARVVNILHKFHVLVMITENPAGVVEINPLVHGALISKRHITPPQGAIL